jgi:hypothetical protein
MKFILEFNPDFYHDLLQAMDWYENQQPGLGNKFFRTVKKQSKELQSTAMNFALRYDDIRCKPLKKFPYMIHFRIDSAARSVKIEALFHTSRDPNDWQKRMDK